MKILLYSKPFYPAIGGVETISMTFAQNMTKLGAVVTVVTETPSEEKHTFPFTVLRNLSGKQLLEQIKLHDIVFANGASMALFFHAKLARKPFVWTHNGYQLSCIDGLGWVNGEAAPINPLGSFRYHRRKSGWKFAAIESMKLLCRRAVGNLVDKNIAATQWVARRQPLRNQIQLYTPYHLEPFIRARQTNQIAYEYDFVFVGRLVSEKGVETLILALAQLVKSGFNQVKLLIVGDGNWRSLLEQKARALSLEKNITFAGAKKGEDLIMHMSKAEIAVVPSEWEEPMGGVALELMATGRCLIVSENGGMAECVGQGGLTFKNGNPEDLAEKMKALYTDAQLRETLKVNGLKRVQEFDEIKLTQMYLDLFAEVVNKNK